MTSFAEDLDRLREAVRRQREEAEPVVGPWCDDHQMPAWVHHPREWWLDVQCPCVQPDPEGAF